MREKQKSLIRLVRRNLYDSMLWLILLAVTVGISMGASQFLTVRNFQSMALQFAPMAIYTIGMLFPLMVGGINLGLVAGGNAACVIMATLYFSEAGAPLLQSGVGIVLCVLLVVVLGVAFGALSGYMIGYLKIPAMLATIAVQQVCNGVSMILTRGVGKSGYSEQFLALSTKVVVGMPLCFWICIVFMVVASVLLRKRIIGVKLVAVGSNATAAGFSGVNVKHVQLAAYMFSGFCSAVGALMMTLQYNSANANQGDSYVLRTVLACVLGGVSPNGGFGRVSGVVISLVLLQFIGSGLNLAGVTSYVQTSMWGAIVLLVMAVDRFVIQRNQ